MIAFQNPWIKPLIYFFSISAVTLGLFWPEIIQVSISAGQDPYAGFRFGEVATQKITGYELTDQRNNADERHSQIREEAQDSVSPCAWRTMAGLGQTIGQ